MALDHHGVDPNLARDRRRIGGAGLKEAQASPRGQRCPGLNRMLAARIPGVGSRPVRKRLLRCTKAPGQAARRLGVQPSRAILFEDALAGVEAGKRGGFGCVVGVGRGHQDELLRQRGADIIIQDLQEVDVVRS